MTVHLVKAKTADLDYLMQLRHATMDAHLAKAGIFLSEAEHLSRIEEYFENCSLIVVKDQTVGMIKYASTGAGIDIMQVQISPDFQGQGTGKAVLEKLMTEAARAGKNITLSVLKDNPARMLYRRLGFVRTGEDDHEYHMVWSG